MWNVDYFTKFEEQEKSYKPQLRTKLKFQPLYLLKQSKYQRTNQQYLLKIVLLCQTEWYLHVTNATSKKSSRNSTSQPFKEFTDFKLLTSKGESHLHIYTHVSHTRIIYLLTSFLFPFVFCVLQHFFFPEVKEIGRISIELQPVLFIISINQCITIRGGGGEKRSLESFIWGKH